MRSSERVQYDRGGWMGGWADVYLTWNRLTIIDSDDPVLDFGLWLTAGGEDPQHADAWSQSSSIYICCSTVLE